MHYPDFRELGEWRPNGYTVERRAVSADRRTETSEYGMWTRLDEARSFVLELEEGMGAEAVHPLAYPARPDRQPSEAYDLSGGDRSVLACIVPGPPNGYRWLKLFHAGASMADLARREGISRQAMEEVIRDRGWRARWRDFERPPESDGPVKFAGPILRGSDGETTMNNMLDLPIGRMGRWAAMWACAEGGGPTVSPELLAVALRRLHLDAAARGGWLGCRVDSIFVAVLVHCAGIARRRAECAVGASGRLARMVGEHVGRLAHG